MNGYQLFSKFSKTSRTREKFEKLSKVAYYLVMVHVEHLVFVFKNTYFILKYFKNISNTFLNEYVSTEFKYVLEKIYILTKLLMSLINI